MVFFKLFASYLHCSGYGKCWETGICSKIISLEFMLEQAKELLDHLENVLANEPIAFQRG
ncbi:hypothetical protein Hdeb2414_s0003g00105181 [Helianthus debilis subsp. tardiflorus]